MGLGAVGHKVADNAKALGMRVIATRRNSRAYKSVDHLYSTTDLANVIDQTDFVSLHLPLNTGTSDPMNSQMFNKMKAGACF